MLLVVSLSDFIDESGRFAVWQIERRWLLRLLYLDHYLVLILDAQLLLACFQATLGLVRCLIKCALCLLRWFLLRALLALKTIFDSDLLVF